MVCCMAAINVAVVRVPLATVLVLAAMTGVAAVHAIAVAAFSAFAFSGGANLWATKRSRAGLEARASPRPAASARPPDAGVGRLVVVSAGVPCGIVTRSDFPGGSAKGPG
jgi:hypothetical protein